MADNTETLGIRLNLQGLPETSNGLAFMGRNLDNLGARADAAAPRLGGVAKSSKEVQAAMRLLPAQITDVVTSLASGQPAWLVAIQQGGQIKDSFGGIGPAFRAVTQAAGPMNLALGGVAAGVGVLLLAHQQGARETQNYIRALTLSGNAAGSSAGQLADVARRTDQIVGTQRTAAAAVTELAATGLVAASNLGRFTEVSVRMERTVGQSFDATAKTFAELGRSPVEASIKLNASANYLTAALYEQIRAAAEQGRTAQAAALAQTAYADAMDQRARTLDASLGGLERAWRGVKDAAAEAWDGMLGIGRPKSAGEEVDNISAQLEALRNRRSTNPQRTAQREAVLLERQAAFNRGLLNQAEKGATDAAAAQATKDYLAAREANDRWAEAALSNTQRMDKALADYRRNNETILRGGGKLDPQQVAREEAAIRQQFNKAPEDPYRTLNGEVQRRLELAQQELAAGAQLSQADRYRIETLARISELEKQRAAPAGLRERVERTAQLMAEAEQQRAAAQAQAQADRQAQRERALATEAAQREVEVLRRSRDELAGETAEIGMNARQIHERRRVLEEAAIAAKEEQLARIEGLPAYAEEAAALREQIRLRREMQGTRAERLDKQEEKQRADERQRTVESMARSIEDGLVGGFRDGRKVADIFLRELKAQFARTVLRVPVQLFAQQLQGAADGLMGWLGAALGNLIPGLGWMTGGGVAFDPGGTGITSGNVGLADLGLGGGRAFGGGVKPGGFHPVNENGMPELLKVGGQSYLMMGGEGGQVTPLKPQGGGLGGGTTIHFAPQMVFHGTQNQAEIMGLVSQGMEAAKQQLVEEMDRRMR